MGFGVSQWIKKDYEFQTATIFLFENQGENWNEANQAKLAAFKQTDFVKYAYPTYQNPSQFRDYNQFIIQNTDGAYLFYDEEQETKLKYLYQEMKKQEQYFYQKINIWWPEWSGRKFFGKLDDKSWFLLGILFIIEYDKLDWREKMASIIFTAKIFLIRF